MARDEGLLPAWDQVHIQDMAQLAPKPYPEHWSVEHLSYAEAETLVDVFQTAKAAAQRFPQIPEHILTEAMARVRELRAAEDAEGDD